MLWLSGALSFACSEGEVVEIHVLDEQPTEREPSSVVRLVGLSGWWSYTICRYGVEPLLTSNFFQENWSRLASALSVACSSSVRSFQSFDAASLAAPDASNETPCAGQLLDQPCATFWLLWNWPRAGWLLQVAPREAKLVWYRSTTLAEHD